MSVLTGRPSGRRHFETGIVEAGCHGAADECVGAEAFGRLPAIGRNDGLRPLATQKIGTQHDYLDRRPVRRAVERERRAGMVVPDLDGVANPVPVRTLSGFQQVVDRG